MDTKQLMEWSAKYHTPNYGRTPLVLVRGDGARVWDSDGKEYLDFTSGIAVTSLGHCHPVVTGAIREAAATLLHVSNIFHNAPQVHLAKMLIEHSFADRVFFCNSGAEANEAALKVVRKYAKEKLATEWEPRFLVCPGGLALPRILADVSALIAGGYRRIFVRAPGRPRRAYFEGTMTVTGTSSASASRLDDAAAAVSARLQSTASSSETATS